MLAGTVALLTGLVYFNSGYSQIHEKYIRNVWTLGSYDSLTYDGRLEVKLGFTATYLHMLRDSTPANAVILFPPDSVLFPHDTTSLFNPLIRNRRWVSYFIYPRKLVYYEERDTLPLYRQVTHVAVAAYWGYNEVSPAPAHRKRYTVLTR